MLENTARLRGAFIVKAISIRFETAHVLHLLWDKGEARVKGKGSYPNNHTRIGKSRGPTPPAELGTSASSSSTYQPTAPEQ